ncbi:carboxypeptidase-like regulatory domain-containing protein [Nonlabens ponticola]|uniref:TonB-dependent receptor n=1 Tax=Nonlabens ponticola TaxID=2496866 RepID=A0A3S9MV52_9FLAO|nr:carboxypeptidase-like regulatory domain-containing protein [Nonlabens ponticola]AZQ43033.1 TonB-dependent receptor [Nonlabens ponticola]
MNQFYSRLLIAVMLLFTSLGTAQELLKGRVIDETTEEPIPGVVVTIKDSQLKVTTDAQGYFVFTRDLQLGDQILVIEANEYITRSIPVVLVEGETVNLDPLYLQVDTIQQEQSVGIISLTENDLSEEDNASNNISGLLQATRDQFLRAAAFDFSATFFRPRGLNSEDGKILINGIEMNKQFSGRPQWSNWGGINDLQRNQTFTMGLTPADNSFGGYGGVQSIDMRATQQRQGTNISYASANRSYQARYMATYKSGLLSSGWAYAIAASRRSGDEGFVEGTLYDANSLSLNVEKKINEDHFINFTGVYAANRRGRRTAITDEIRDLKGIDYNPFWGLQEGAERNSRIREIDEPFFILSHNWNVNPKIKWNTNVSYQFGKIGNTRIDNGGTRLVNVDGQNTFLGGARNPNPDYYQNLPSFFLRNGQDLTDLGRAYRAEQDFIQDGQLNWNDIYEANRILRESGGNSIYIIQEDRIDDNQFQASSIITADLADNILFNGGVSYRKLESENYALAQDLLGGTGYLDVDFFAEETTQITQDQAAQSDIRNPNRIVTEGDRYKYNYVIDANVASAFAQAQFKTNKVDFYVAGNVSQTDYQREGLYENGNFPGEQSFGKSEKVDFTNFGVKGGATYKINGLNFLDLNAAYLTRAPYIRNTFVNARQNNLIVDDIESERSYSLDASYIYRSPIVKARLTGYAIQFKDGNDLGFYFTEDLTGLPADDGAAFVQEVMTDVDRRNMGVELGVEVQVTPTIKLKGAAAVGQNVYTNNPNLYLTSDDFPGQLTFGDGKAQLKNLHVAGGPETAMQLGFEYRDPDYWNIGVTANYFANGYSDISNLRRTANFSQDSDGIEFAGFDEDIARELLRQEQFDDYMLVNVIGGKSWRIDNKFVGFFATINNVFDQEYKTGGFEQSRNSNFRSVQEDQNNPTEVFAPRYFFGNGTTYYLNVYLRF